jgi:N-acetylneuraminic acid mutarotase
MGGLTVWAGPNVDTVEAYNPATNMWKKAASMPTPRFVLAATKGSDGRIYAIGGGSPGPPTPAALGTVEAYSPATKTWTAIASLPTPRYGLGATSSGGRIYAIGGRCVECLQSPKPGAEVDSYTP